MAETLLRSNRRAASMLCAAATLPVALGAFLLAWGRRTDQTIISWTGVLMVFAGVLLVRRQLALLIPPRLALARDHLLVYGRGFIPWRVPLDDVECFFIGQAPSAMRVAHPTGGRVENVTVVVRLAQRASAWHQQRINPLLGKWCNGYITLFGMWCEPLDGDLVNRMNHRLAEVKRIRKRPQHGAQTR